MATETVVGAASAPVQSVIGQAPVSGAAPTKSSSLWVGELATDVNESKLFEFFNPIAAVQSVRVCRHALTRESLGYAYVNFQTPADAEAAMENRNYTDLNGKTIRIMWAVRDPLMRRSNVGNVVVKKLPDSFTDRQLHDIFKEFGSILSVKVARDAKGHSKGYGFVHFDSDRAAKDAIEVINGMEISGRNLQVESFVPRNQRQTAPDKWNNLFIKNLPKSYSEEQLKAIFTPFGSITSAKVMRDESGASKAFGFVCFADHESAAKAAQTLNEKDVDTLPGLTQDDIATANRADSKEGESDASKASGGEKPKMKLYVGKAVKKEEREKLLKEKQEASKREWQSKYHGCNLFVKYLEDSVDDDTLRKEFQPFGTIVSAKVQKDSENRSRGFGFVCFETPEAANKAQSAMNRKAIAGKPLYVALLETKEVRQARLNATHAQGAARTRQSQALAGQAATQNVNNFAGVNQQQALMAMMQPQMLMQGMMAMAMANPQMMETINRMGPQGLQQFMQQYISQIQALARGNMGGMVPGGSPSGAAAGARGPAGFNRPMGGFMGGQAGVPGAGGMANQGPRAAAGGNQRPARVGGPAGVPGSTAPGVVRVANGPQQGSPAARGPMQAMPQQGARPNGPAAGMPGAMAGPRPGMPTQAAVVAANMQAMPNARNMPGMPLGMIPGMAVPGMVDPAAAMAAMAQQMGVQQQAAAAPAPATSRESFVQQLASVSNAAARKSMIGEHLYTQVFQRNRERAAKITGMLLDGMEDSDLLNLLETPSELESRIQEALDVLKAHQSNSGTS